MLYNVKINICNNYTIVSYYNKQSKIINWYFTCVEHCPPLGPGQGCGARNERKPSPFESYVVTLFNVLGYRCCHQQVYPWLWLFVPHMDRAFRRLCYEEIIIESLVAVSRQVLRVTSCMDVRTMTLLGWSVTGRSWLL